MSSDKIAVTGISLKFPGSANYAQFWQRLINGDDVRSVFPKERLKLILNTKEEIWEKYHSAQYSIPGYYLDNIDHFDADFFQIPPAEAVRMDPRHRLFLMLVWEALQDAGYTREAIQNTEAGVFLGYAPKWDQEYVRFFSEEEPTQIEGNNTPNCAARPSYWLNLGGPAITVNTSCSSSLVACHLGIQSLGRKECSLAIVGGIQCNIFPFWDKEPDIGIESVDHCCKTFDAKANGTAFGEGVAVLILKRLNDAIEAGDPIHAMIRGSALNSDGRSNGLSAPNPSAQVALIQKALRQVQLSPDDIGYFEAHGTGTKLGDPIEVDAICKVVRKNKHAPYMGSVKPNIGHLGDTAGLGGAIKAILCLKHRKIPRQIHYYQLNPHLQKAEKYLTIPTKNLAWELTGEQVHRRAGVSSFGVSGTNAHVIVEEYFSAVEAQSTESRIQLPLTLSGPTPASLWDYLQQLRDFLEAHPETQLSDLTYTSNFHREHFTHRICIWADSLSLLKKKVDQLADWREFEEFPKRFFSQGIWTSLYPTPPGNLELTHEMALAKDYIAGEVVEFKGLYKDVSPKCIFMPYAPLNLKSYWLESENRTLESVSDLFYDFAWEEKPSSIIHDVDVSLCLLFADRSPFTERVIKQLAQWGKKAIFVSAGSTFNRVSSSEWVIRANNPEDYRELIEQIRAEYQSPLKEILHLWSYLPPEIDALSPEEIKKIKELSLFSLFHLSKTLVECLSSGDLRLNLISSYGKKVQDADQVQPLRAMAYGFIRVLSQEHPWLGTYGIDLEYDPDCEHLSEILVKEILLPREKRSLLAAVRNGKMYTEVIAPKKLPKCNSGPIVKNGEVIVLIGGSGYLGRLLMSYISDHGNAHFVVLSRSSPDDEFVESITEKGCDLIHFHTDVYVEPDIKNAMEQIQTHYGKIDVVYILTKDLAHQLIKDISFQEFSKKISGRIDALSLIRKYAAPLSPKRWIIFSSISSILGGKTACECCAVNQFFDSMAHDHSGEKTQVINLTLIDDDRNLNLGMTPIPAIQPKEFLRGLFFFLKSGEKFSILSRFNFKDIEYLKPVIKLQFSKEMEENVSMEKPTIGQKKYTREQMARAMLDIWKKVLGYEEIDSQANFFEIGGTSLSALKLTKLVRENLCIESSVTDLFQHPRFDNLCHYYLFKQMPKSTRATTAIDSLVDRVSSEELSIEEALEEMSWSSR